MAILTDYKKPKVICSATLTEICLDLNLDLMMVINLDCNWLMVICLEIRWAICSDYKTHSVIPKD